MALSDAKPWVVDVQPTSFQSEVVDKSHKTPVVVDFYADWCRPCQMLAPALEKAIEKHAGRILLAKVDTERMPEIAGQFNVSSIPAVFALRGGEIVDQFVGMLSEPELERWVDELLPSAGETLLAEARAILQINPGPTELKLAESKLREAIAETPQLVEAKLALIELLWNQRRTVEVRELLGELEARGYLEPAAEAIKAALAIDAGGQAAGGLEACRTQSAAAPDDLQGQFELARALAAAGQHQEALEKSLNLVERDRKQFGQQARELMVDIFRILPADSPLTTEYRRKLSTALY